MSKNTCNTGYQDGFNNSHKPMEDYKLAECDDRYRADYVAGVCATIHVPAEYWPELAGERAADLGVPLGVLKEHMGLDDEQAPEFERGYQRRMEEKYANDEEADEVDDDEL